MQVRLPDVLTAEQVAEVRDALLHVCQVQQGEIDREASWDATVYRVAATQLKVDGRSGAIVLDAAVTTQAGAPAERRIIKIDDAAAIAKEWRSIKAIHRPELSRMVVPAVAVSGFIENPERLQLPGRQLAAIIYGHVANFSHNDQPVVSLEDLARDKFANLDEIVQIISFVMAELGQRFWGASPRELLALEDLNGELGTDLTLEINRRTGTRTLSYDNPTPHERSTLLFNASHVLAAATQLQPPGRTSLEVGALVELRGITAKSTARDALLGTLGNVSVEIRCVGDAIRQLDFRDAEWHRARDLVVVGRVASIRTLGWWDRIKTADPQVTLEADSILVDTMRIGQPCAQLTSVLTEELPGRALGLTHGDLNPRNILVAGGLIYLIDFAEAADRSPLIDPAWLEICLLRDVFGRELGSRRLVRLQRLLGLASSVVDSMRDTWDPVTELAIGDAELQRVFKILWAVRRGARNWHRQDATDTPWWRDYLAHLTIAGLRTLKWDDSKQDKAAIHAVLAATGVAAEWLRGNPYRNWHGADLRQAALQVLPNIDAGSDEAGTLLENLVAGVDFAGIHDDQIHNAIEQCRDLCVRSWYAPAAAELISNPSRNPAEYIDLRALLGRPADSPADLDTSGERFPQVDETVEGARRRTRDLLDASSAVNLAARVRSAVVVLVGDVGAGKTTVARALQFRQAEAVLRAPRPAAVRGAVKTGANEPDLPPMIPVTLTAAEIDAAMAGVSQPERSSELNRIITGLLTPLLGQHVGAALRLGGVHITIDGFDEFDVRRHARIIGWILALSETYGRLRIVVCHRGFDTEEAAFTSLVLQEVSATEAREYIRKRFHNLGLANYDEKADELLAQLTGDDVNESIRELAHTPRFLWAVTESFAAHGALPSRPGELVRGLTRFYLNRRLEEPRAQRGFTYRTCIKALEILASHLLDHDSTTDEPTAIDQLASLTEHPRELLHLLIGSELIGRINGRITFLRQAFQHFFAAVVLQRQEPDPARLVARLLGYGSRDALEIIRFADASRELVHELIDRVLPTDPVFAAHALRWTDDPRPDDVERFLTNQERILFGPSGEHSWNTAVNALFEYGTEDARGVLHGVARSTDAHDLARSAALAGLLRMRGATPFVRRRLAAERETTQTVRRLLDTAEQTRLRITAINAVVDGGLRSLIAYLAGLIDARQPWPVLRAAWRSLTSLDQVLSRDQQAVYVDACARRLPECDKERLCAVDRSTIEELQDERWELIAVLSHAGRLDLVLPTRFSYATTEPDYWSNRKRLTSAPREAVPPATQPAWDVLHGEHTPSALIELFDIGDDYVAVAAAHRLLSEHRHEAGELVRRVTADSSPQKLLAVAATFQHLDDDGLTRVREIVIELKNRMPWGQLEALAAFLTNMPANKRSTRRLLLETMLRHRETYPNAEHGPIERMFAQSTRWSDAEISNIVLSGDEGRELVIRGLSLVLYPNDARRFERTRLAKTAAEAISRYEPDSLIEQLTYIRACTEAGLPVGLAHAYAAANDSVTAGLLEKSVNPRYGTEMVSRLGEVLTCLGYLGRQAFERKQEQLGERAYEFLRAFDTTSMHCTVQRGRLLGLAILGDWLPLLSALWTNDARMHRAARNAVFAWRPGPRTPYEAISDISVVRRIDDQLTNMTAPAPDVRSTLTEIKTLAERHIGQIIVSGH